jgi:DNA-binding CsgD family transcriptional regulator
LSLKEVAEIQEISIETAKTRRRYAYEKLKPYIEAMK